MKNILILSICFLALSCDDNFTDPDKFKEVNSSSNYDHFYSLSCYDSQSTEIFKFIIDTDNNQFEIKQTSNVPFGINVVLDNLDSTRKVYYIELHELNKIDSGTFVQDLDENPHCFPSEKFDAGAISYFSIMVIKDDEGNFNLRQPNLKGVILSAVFDKNRYPNINGKNGYCLEVFRDSRSTNSKMVWY